MSIATILNSSDSVLRGLQLGFRFNRIREQELTVRQGREHFLTFKSNLSEVALAYGTVHKIFEKLGRAGPMSYFHNFCVIALPAGISYLASYNFKNFYLRKIINLAEDHLGTFALAAIVISNVALFALGYTLMASTTLACIAIGIADRYHLFPDRLHNTLQSVGWIVANVGGLVYGDPISRLLCLAELVTAAVSTFFKFKNCRQQLLNEEIVEIDVYPDEPPTLINKERLMAITDQSQFNINRSHLNKEILPTINENTDIDIFNQICERIDWQNHLQALKVKLNHDERWKELTSQEGREVEFLKQNLRLFIDSIKNRQILHGRPRSYEAIQRYTKFIAEKIVDMDEIEQADIIMVLGIEGGDYCGPGKFRVIEETFLSLASTNGHLPLDIRILANLQQARLDRFQNCYLALWKTLPLVRLCGQFTKINNIHNVNQYVAATNSGKRFGIPHQGAVNDPSFDVSPVTYYLSSQSMSFLLDDSFWNGRPIPQIYLSWNTELPLLQRWKIWKWIKVENLPTPCQAYDQNGVIHNLQEIIGTPALPKTDIYAWWQDWIERQDNLSPQEKEAAQDELTNATLFGEPIEENGKIRNKFLIPMLQEMGVLSHA